MNAKEASTVKRMAANIASGLIARWERDCSGNMSKRWSFVTECVDLAIAINDEVDKRLEAPDDPA